MTPETTSGATGTTGRQRVFLSTVSAVLLAPVYGAIAFAPVVETISLTATSPVTLAAGGVVGLGVLIPFRIWRSRRAARTATVFLVLATTSTVILTGALLGPTPPVRGSVTLAGEYLRIAVGAAGLSLAAAWYVVGE